MKTKYFFLIVFISLIVSVPCLSQNFLPRQLYIKVSDPSGIPKITVKDGDTILSMDNATLQQIFRDNHVYSFTRSFTVADSMKPAKKYGLDKVYSLSCNCDVNGLIQEIQGQSTQEIYAFVEKIPVYAFVYSPNDYHLQDSNPLTGIDSALNLINAKTAWDYTKGDSNVLIGIVDGNLMASSYWNHEDINGKIVFWDTVNGSSDYFHGLFVSGCAAGNTDNGVGKSSIGNKCRLMFSSHSWSAEGLLTLSYHGAKVLNASWGSPQYSNTMQLAINAVTDNGTLVVAAAGNWPDATGKFGYHYYPASNNNVLSVTSIDYNDHFITWDTNITAQHHNYNDSVDICAPGYHVLGLWDACSSCYKRATGTSFASPIVAGTAGLVFSINPCLKPSDVTTILKSTANDTIYSIAENQPFLDSLGAGRLDAAAAVKLADSLYKPRNYYVQNGQNISWNANKYVESEIVIATGGTLTIHSTVLFNPNARITIQRGGKLIVDGGKLTSNCACGMWSGIDVWGNRSLSQFYQTNQGVAIFQNGAIVENAITAVRTLRPTPTDEDEWSYEMDYTGGIIIGNNAIFRNNQRAVLFQPYENFHPVTNAVADNYSYFTNCTFETTDDYIDSTKIVSCFTDLNGVRGIKYNGCTFRNTKSGGVSRELLGNGINSLSSSFYVRETCLDPYVPCVHVQPTSFANLNYGIKALGTDPAKTVLVDKSLFSNNYTGIYLGSIQQATITRDTFYVKCAVTSTNVIGGGLYLNECHNYTVTENYFYSDYSTSIQTQAKSVGVAVNNSNLGNYLNVYNVIYNNRFEKLNYCILPMNKNRNTNGSFGLELKCNDFIYPNEFDIAVTKEPGTSLMGIRYNQGTNAPTNGSPAGNTFSYTWVSTGAPYSDYFNQGENLIYWYHPNYGGANIVPWHHSPTPIVYPQPAVNSPAYYKPYSCPSSLTTGGGGAIEDLLTEKNVSEEKADSVAGLLALLVDGGDTPGTESFIQTSTNFQTLEVRDDLLSKTPYLSDSVMVSAASKEDVLPPAIITEILAANPQAGKSDTIMQILENRTVPLTEDQLAEIQDGLFIVGAKESLETKLAGYKSEYNAALRMILQHYKNDSLNPMANDSVIWYLNAENQLWAKYTLAFEYLGKGDIVNGENILNNIPDLYSLNAEQLFEHQQYLSFFNMATQLAQQGKSIPEVDSAQVQALTGFLNNSNGLIAGYARNILVAKGLAVYQEPYILPEGEVKSSKIRYKSKKDKFDLNNLKIYPNPARDYIIIEYTLKTETDNAMICIYDFNGKPRQYIPLENTSDYLVVPVTGLPAGGYVCTISQNNRPVQSARFIVVK